MRGIHELIPQFHGDCFSGKGGTQSSLRGLVLWKTRCHPSGFVAWLARGVSLLTRIQFQHLTENSGSFVEFLAILSLMKEKYTSQELPYHIIVPSLPGYGFSSSPPLHRDFNIDDVAAIVNQLMLDLGFDSGYIAQGGDIGSRVAKTMAWKYQSCKGSSIQFPLLSKQFFSF
jgi:alpha/beta hydrolase fold